MDYLVELKVDTKYSFNGETMSTPNQGKSLFVRVEADSLEEAAEKAEVGWGYKAESVGVTPDQPTYHSGHSSRGVYRYPVDHIETPTITVGSMKL